MKPYAGWVPAAVLAVLLAGIAWVLVADTPIHRPPPPAVTTARRPLTYVDYMRLEPGQTTARVFELLGNADALGPASENTKGAMLITWKNPDGSHIAATFIGDQLTSKTQAGLR